MTGETVSVTDGGKIMLDNFQQLSYNIACWHARVVELADSLDSGSSAPYGRAGSSPASRTKITTPSGVVIFLHFLLQRKRQRFVRKGGKVEVIKLAKLLSAAAAVTALAAAGAVVGSVLRWARRITEGTRCQLRSEMLRTYYHHREEELIRQYEYENFVYCYEAYTALGGNSFIGKIYEEIKTWEVVT